MQYTINTDGGARGNPGPAGAGAVIRDGKGTVVATVSKFLGHRTNNFAEYEAAILAFEKLAQLVSPAKHKQTDVIVRMDSELVVKQMRREYRVKHPILKQQQEKLDIALATFGNISFVHVARKENKDADLLANEAMDSARR